jgi:stage II sporulation protein M
MDMTQKKTSPYILLATALFIMSLIWGLLMNPDFIGEMLGDLTQSLLQLGSLPPAVLFAVIFLNNSIKSLLSIVLGIAIGIPPLIFLCFNGFIIGAMISALQSRTSNIMIIASLAPHGVIELPAIVLATALGFKVGFESIKYLINRQSNVKVQLRQSLVIYMKCILIMLFVAALIETFATPLLVSRLGGIELPTP